MSCSTEEQSGQRLKTLHQNRTKRELRWSVLRALQAGKVARLFARFDLNDDGRLDLFEMTKLACVFMTCPLLPSACHDPRQCLMEHMLHQERAAARPHRGGG